MKLITLTFLFFLTSCSGIQLITPGARDRLYTEDFLTQIESIKQLYAQGETDVALSRLQAMPEEKLLPTEEALKRNLIGVIYFSMGNFEQAIFQFDSALVNSRLDNSLTSQIYLNLASSYYRLGRPERAFNALSRSEHRRLTPEEAKKHHQLHYVLAKELSRDREMAIALIRYYGDKERVSDIRNDVLFSELTSAFFRLSRREKIRVIEEFESEQSLPAAYIAYLEAERLYYEGQRQEAIELLSWLERRFRERGEVQRMAQNFIFRLEHFTQMNQTAIAIALPLSGERAEFGQRALLGIDAALKKWQEDQKERSAVSEFQLFIADTEGQAAIGAHRVNELIENHNVSVVIGGLFSEEAQKQYREARKRGVFYISLSQLYLPRNEKNHLLLEIPGSIESQLAKIFEPQTLNELGHRGAIIFPESARGEAYINELWAIAGLNEIEINGVISYPKGTNDFRDPVRHLLGLSQTRSRAEEETLLAEIYQLEGRRAVRRVQTLDPQFDFDWVFIPAYPVEALQIIPNFNYFGARGVNLIGGPSWRSRTLLNQSSRLGRLYFIADDITPIEREFSEWFQNKYGNPPRLIELRGHDAMKIATDLLSQSTFETRDQFEMAIRSTEQVKARTGQWSIVDDMWLKDMAALEMHRGRMNPMRHTVRSEALPDLNREMTIEVETDL